MDNLPKAFDYLFYSSYYSDLKNAYGTNEALLKKHYLHHGRFEGRKYCNLPENFNWIKYIDYINYINNTQLLLDSKEEAIHHYVTVTAPKILTLTDYESSVPNFLDIDDHIDTDVIHMNSKPIYILYFCFLNRSKDWMRMIHDQLKDVKNSGIFLKSKFHAVIYGHPEDIIKAQSMMENLIVQKIDITPIYTNCYEFPGIIKIQELALQNPDKIFIYFHSKGMVNNNFGQYRTMLERKLTLSTFLNWDETLYKFNTNPTIQKAGLMPAETGWIWFNFWWARGSYLASCNPIIESDDRFVCEGWLGANGSQTWKDSYSIINKNISFSADPSTDCWTKTCHFYDQ
jgi:hypothetical protein